MEPSISNIAKPEYRSLLSDQSIAWYKNKKDAINPAIHDSPEFLIENAELFAVADAEALAALDEAEAEPLTVLVALVTFPPLEEEELVWAAALLDRLESEISGPVHIRNHAKISKYSK